MLLSCYLTSLYCYNCYCIRAPILVYIYPYFALLLDASNFHCCSYYMHSLFVCVCQRICFYSAFLLHVCCQKILIAVGNPHMSIGLIRQHQSPFRLDNAVICLSFTLLRSAAAFVHRLCLSICLALFCSFYTFSLHIIGFCAQSKAANQCVLSWGFCTCIEKLCSEYLKQVCVGVCWCYWLIMRCKFCMRLEFLSKCKGFEVNYCKSGWSWRKK